MSHLWNLADCFNPLEGREQDNGNRSPGIGNLPKPTLSLDNDNCRVGTSFLDLTTGQVTYTCPRSGHRTGVGTSFLYLTTG